MFGVPQPDGQFAPFSLYTMRQAIEEGFILDVLENYTSYETFWELLKNIPDDPMFDKKKTEYLLKQFVSHHEFTIAKKVAIMLEHFVDRSMQRLGGKAKGMIVTSSRRQAVRYRLAVILS